MFPCSLSHYTAPDKLPNLLTLQFPSSVKCNNTVYVTSYLRTRKQHTKHLRQFLMTGMRQLLKQTRHSPGEAEEAAAPKSQTAGLLPPMSYLYPIGSSVLTSRDFSLPCYRGNYVPSISALTANIRMYDLTLVAPGSSTAVATD